MIIFNLCFCNRIKLVYFIDRIGYFSGIIHLGLIESMLYSFLNEWNELNFYFEEVEYQLFQDYRQLLEYMPSYQFKHPRRYKLLTVLDIMQLISTRINYL